VQVTAYVESRVLQACSRAMHDTYDLMTFEGDPGTVERVISYQSVSMRAVRPLVFACKTTYGQLHPRWRQNNIDLYKLRITFEKWAFNLNLCRSMQRELQTAPAPGMMRMIGFAGNTPIVAEVPLADAPVIAQHMDIHMLS
jgi:hypothetical protein